MPTNLKGPDLQRLRQALTLEARHQYPNLKGNKAYFADFVAGELKKLVAELPAADRARFVPYTAAFDRYAWLSPPERADVVGGLQALLPSVVERVESQIGKEPDWRDRPVQFVKGIGPRAAELLAKVNVHTVDDLLRYYPRQYLDYNKRVRIGQLQAGETVTVWGEVKKVEAYNPPNKPNMSILTVWISDGTGSVAARWFGKKRNKFQHDQLKKRFPIGQSVLMSGEPKFDSYAGRMIFDRPEAEVLGDTDGTETSSLHIGRIVPIYPLTDGLNLKTLRKAMRAALDLYLPLVRDSMPAAVRDALELVPLKKALEQIHFPKSDAEQKDARDRLAFDELFWLQLGLAYKRAQSDARTEALVLPASGTFVSRLKEALPFQLTGAQERVFREIQQDLAANTPMNRLVQGDVGSGKTIVALLSLLIAVENGYQGALMAPTEILAEQHYAKISVWLRDLGLETALVLGRQGRKERNAVLRAVEAGLVHIVIGTHALIQEKIAYKDLGLVVIDEQHRFGVKQRALLREKGRSPEVLVMTATPIPRTLALTVHGDLDVSVIDELPPGRKPVETKWARTKREATEVWEAVRTQIQQGRQCYVVYPLIEDSDAEDFAHVKSATERHEWLSTEVYHGWEVALLHGQMTPQEKDGIMERFRRGEIHVLVSTTVIEVGVDVPNASIMVIENAERFGLAQLHQLRGRVGRGAYQSYCYLMSESRGESTAQRLGIMEATNDGFVIAEQDLKLRGPGEFLGTRQSGMPDMLLANLVEDTRLLERAREVAIRMVAADPTLDQRPLLKQDLFRYFKANLSFLDVG
ncbi:MAG: ATP-dependent helicase RecG [Cyanobacteria bacterium RYN_339]|nr:ATP-dependent helicase RecG [Cyanobacteria bacterium RYN_339]